HRDWSAGGLRRLARAAAAHVPGSDGAHAALVRREPLHLRHGPVADGARADHRGRAGSRRGVVRRSGAAGPRADGHRDWLRHHGAVAGVAARAASADGHRPRRRARAMNAVLEQLVALPVVVPLLAGAAMLLLTEA